MLHLGADANTKIQKASKSSYLAQAGWMPLHLAARKGHLAMVKLLFEIGADPEARAREMWTPLYVALVWKHKKIARTIARHISNLQNYLVEARKD